MNSNNYRKIVHCPIWFGNKIMLSQVLKDSWDKGFWSDAGGKVEPKESILDAVKREVYEETNLYLHYSIFHLVDCFILDKRKIKAFVFDVKLTREDFIFVKNKEPKKQSNWELFKLKDALKLNLTPSVRFYLENFL